MQTRLSNLIEPLSASPRSTSREKKIPFGPVAKVSLIDDNYIRIVNRKGEEVMLEFEKLSPLIDREDGRLKKELIHLQNKGAMSLVSALNDLILQLHHDKFRKKKITSILARQDTLPRRNSPSDSQEEKASSCYSSSPSQVFSSQSQSAKEQKVSECETDGSATGEPLLKRKSSRYSLRSSHNYKNK